MLGSVDDQRIGSVIRAVRHRRGLRQIDVAQTAGVGDCGSVDILGWQPTERALLIVEVKTRLANVQQLFSAFARKVRIVPELIATERGWDARSVGRVLVISGTTANRTVVERLRSSFDVTFPSRAREVRRWLDRPVGPVAGIWFIAPITSAHRTHDRPARSRVRRPIGTAAADATSLIERP